MSQKSAVAVDANHSDSAASSWHFMIRSAVERPKKSLALKCVSIVLPFGWRERGHVQVRVADVSRAVECTMGTTDNGTYFASHRYNS